MWLLPENQVDLSELEGRKFRCIDDMRTLLPLPARALAP